VVAPSFRLFLTPAPILNSKNPTGTQYTRDLGFHLDSELCMKQHVAKVVKACFYHLRRLRQIRRRVGEEVTTRLVLALVIPRLDYCNSLLLARLPLCTTELLQRVQSAAARLIFELSPSEHITPSLLQLRWLPIRWRVQFKLCCLMQLSPDAVQRIRGASCNQLHSRVSICDHQLRLLCTADKDQVRRASLLLRRLVCVEHSNTLPRHIHETFDSDSFRKLLKTHYFTLRLSTSPDFNNCFIFCFFFLH